MNSVGFNFENFLLELGAIRSSEVHARDLGAIKVAEYEYKDYQFVVVTNEFGIKTTLAVMQNWNPLESRYCCAVPRTETFAKELIEHLTNFRESFDVDNLN